LVDAEPAQPDLLDRVLAGPVLTMPTLTEHGVLWADDRHRPHAGLHRTRRDVSALRPAVLS
jgi:hypothetical protein